MKEENISLFDAYLREELSEAESIEFEARIKTDLEFKEAFESYKELATVISDSQEYLALEKKLKGIHQANFKKKKSYQEGYMLILL